MESALCNDLHVAHDLLCGALVEVEIDPAVEDQGHHAGDWWGQIGQSTQTSHEPIVITIIISRTCEDVRMCWWCENPEVLHHEVVSLSLSLSLALLVLPAEFVAGQVQLSSCHSFLPPCLPGCLTAVQWSHAVTESWAMIGPDRNDCTDTDWHYTLLESR